MTRAAQALRETEASLRDLLSKAAAAGDYAGVVQIASWASMIKELADSCREGKTGAPVVAAGLRKTGRSIARAIAATRARASHATSRKDYPRFFRRGDHLVRVAWSKREKKEYQHKASHAVLEALAGVMAEAGNDGRVFSTDDFLPINDADGSHVLSYQAYVCIALLKHTGLIDQHGRQGYSIPRLAEFRDAVESLWRNLPQH